jgi:hypothetical protein
VLRQLLLLLLLPVPTKHRPGVRLSAAVKLPALLLLLLLLLLCQTSRGTAATGSADRRQQPDSRLSLLQLELLALLPQLIVLVPLFLQLLHLRYQFRCMQYQGFEAPQQDHACSCLGAAMKVQLKQIPQLCLLCITRRCCCRCTLPLRLLLLLLTAVCACTLCGSTSLVFGVSPAASQQQAAKRLVLAGPLLLLRRVVHLKPRLAVLMKAVRCLMIIRCRRSSLRVPGCLRYRTSRAAVPPAASVLLPLLLQLLLLGAF